MYIYIYTALLFSFFFLSNARKPQLRTTRRYDVTSKTQILFSRLYTFLFFSLIHN